MPRVPTDRRSPAALFVLATHREREALSEATRARLMREARRVPTISGAVTPVRRRVGALVALVGTLMVAIGSHRFDGMPGCGPTSIATEDKRMDGYRLDRHAD